VKKHVMALSINFGTSIGPSKHVILCAQQKHQCFAPQKPPSQLKIDPLAPGMSGSTGTTGSVPANGTTASAKSAPGGASSVAPVDPTPRNYLATHKRSTPPEKKRPTAKFNVGAVAGFQPCSIPGAPMQRPLACQNHVRACR
jgi:hypothetical protein